MLEHAERYTIRQIRESNHLTLKEFAEKLGVTFVTVHFWETGRHKPFPKNLRAVAREFDLEPSQIIVGVDARTYKEG